MSAVESETGDAPCSAASAKAFCDARNACCATKRARSSPSRNTWRVRRPTYSAETTVTTASTSTEVASVNLVFRLRRIIPPRPIFLQFVVQRLEADAQQVRRTSFVLTCRGERLSYEFAFHRIHRRADRESNRA